MTKKTSGSEKVIVYQNTGDFEDELEVYLKADENGRNVTVQDSSQFAASE